MASRVPFLLILPAAIGFLLMLPASADKYFLLSGETLATDGQLSNGNAHLVMQGDCNLVLYTTYELWYQSNTAKNGKQCSVTLSNKGQLILKDGSGKTLWTTPAHSQGTYAAVLRSDQRLAIYGPQVWSTPAPSSPVEGEWFPLQQNVLFSGQYVFILQLNGQAAIYGPSVWDSSNARKHGQAAIYGPSVWDSSNARKRGVV